MKSQNVRKNLRQAYEAVDRVCSDHPEMSRKLAGIREQLEYAVDGGAIEPEAVVALERGALDTIQRRLDESIAETAHEQAAAELREAREKILLVIVTLEDEWKKQHESPAIDE